MMAAKKLTFGRLISRITGYRYFLILTGDWRKGGGAVGAFGGCMCKNTNVSFDSS